MMTALELDDLVDEWWKARMIDMADEGDFLDGSGVSVCTHAWSHLPFPPEGGSRCPAATRTSGGIL